MMEREPEHTGAVALAGILLLVVIAIAGLALAYYSSPGQASDSTTQQAGGTITVFAHRVPSSYWSPCFALTCDQGTGPGTSMYFVLYDSSGNVVQTGFADENGHVFSGLNPGSTYYVYPVDCDLCHGSNHDVTFQQWGNGSTTRPLPTPPGSSLDAWYSCTNSCA